MDSKTELIASQLCIPPKNELTWRTREQKKCYGWNFVCFLKPGGKNLVPLFFEDVYLHSKVAICFGSFTSIIWLRIAFVVFRTILRFFFFFDKIQQEASLHQQRFHEVSVQRAPNCRIYLNAAQMFLQRQYIGAQTKQLPMFVTYSNTWTLSIIATKGEHFFPWQQVWEGKSFSIYVAPVFFQSSAIARFKSSKFISYLRIPASFQFQCYKFFTMRRSFVSKLQEIPHLETCPRSFSCNLSYKDKVLLFSLRLSRVSQKTQENKDY